MPEIGFLLTRISQKEITFIYLVFSILKKPFLSEFCEKLLLRPKDGKGEKTKSKHENENLLLNTCGDEPCLAKGSAATYV